MTINYLVFEDEMFYINLLKSVNDLNGFQGHIWFKKELFKMDDISYLKITPSQVDVILLDLNLNGKSSINFIPILHKIYYNASILILTGSESFEDFLLCLELGAEGYLIKTFSSERLSIEIQSFAKHGAFISPFMSKKLINHLRDKKETEIKSFKLTEKEIETLRLLSQGLTYEECSELINVSVDGIRSRIRRVYKKINVNSRYHAIKYYRDHLLGFQ